MEVLTTLLVYLGWLAFITVIGVIARQIAILFAKRKGWTALNMPLKYSIWFIAVTGVIWIASWVILEKLI